MLTRDQALALLAKHLTDAQLVSHSLESEAVLAALARRLGKDETLWGIVGLLHDLDYAATKDQPERHGLAAAEMLAGLLPEEALNAIRAHNGERTGVAPTTDLDFALRAGETVTGLIHTNALVRPARMDGMDATIWERKAEKFSDREAAAASFSLPPAFWR